MIDHTNCIHPRTPAGRRECRSLGGPAGWAAANAAGLNDTTPDRISTVSLADRMSAVTAVKITGPVARRMARTAAKADNARIQPRRSGARVAATNSTCVQAALHTGDSVCACGARSGRYAEDVNAW